MGKLWGIKHIGQTEADWLEGGPWIQVDEDFNHMVDEAEGVLENFTLPCEGDQRVPHELAHCIRCTDEELFQPSWGYPSFTYQLFGNPHYLTVEAALNEAMVMHIEEKICAHLNNWITDPHKTWRLDRTHSRMADILLAATNWHIKLNHLQLMKKFNEAQERFPNVQSCWDELQRKYVLIKG